MMTGPKMTKQTDYLMVLIMWKDAHADESWAHVDDIDDEPYIVRSVGWRIPNKKRGHVTLAQSLGDGGHVDHILHIPKGMIVSQVTLKP